MPTTPDVAVNFEEGSGPTVGDVVVGYIEETTYGPKFKRDKNEGSPFTIVSFSENHGEFESHGKTWWPYQCELDPRGDASQAKPATQSGSNGSSREDYWNRKEARDIAAEPRMARAHAQEMACMVEAMDVKPEELDQLTFLAKIDFFFNDAQNAQPFDVGGGGGPSAASGISVAGDGAASAPSAELDAEISAAYDALLDAGGDKEAVRKWLMANKLGKLEEMSPVEKQMFLEYLREAHPASDVPF